jgi:hypothetical protein
MSNIKKKTSKYIILKKKLKLTRGNLTNQQLLIWDRDKKKSKRWPCRKNQSSIKKNQENPKPARINFTNPLSE